MNLADLTPCILTYNEEPNIARCLARLGWASQILVVDSGSIDRTLELIAACPQARVAQRPFDSHTRQANFALSLITTPWVLSLDADYILTPAFEQMLRAGEWDEECACYAPFRLCVRGRPLRASLYPPRAVLYAREGAVYEQDGHTQRLVLAGRRPVFLPEPLLHDDRKSFSRWRENQRKYALLEVEKLRHADPAGLGWPDKLRRTGWAAPLIIVPYILFVRGLVLDGWRGVLYALERGYVEFILAFYLWRRTLHK